MNKSDKLRKKIKLDKDVQLQSSLFLQILLFLNVRFYAIWIIISVYYFWIQMDKVSNIEYVLTLISFIVSIPVEGFRLYFGYLGNLTEQIPDLAGFWILSALIRLPIEIYLILTKHTNEYLIARLCHYTAFLLLILQIGAGFYTIRRFSKIGAKQFHLQRLIQQNIIVATTSDVYNQD